MKEQSQSMSSLVATRTIRLISFLERDTSESNKIKSYLRKTDGILENSPDIWGVIYRGEDETEGELSQAGYQAVLTALKFYALHAYLTPNAHRYSKDGGVSMGEYLANFRKTSSGSNIDSKITSILVSQDYNRTVRLLEGLFKRSTKSIHKSIDYANFSRQLLALQNPAFQKSVIADWGKKYYQASAPKNQAKPAEKE